MVSRGKENEKIKPLLKKLFFKLSYSYEKTTRIIVKDKTVLQATVTSMVGKNDYPRMTKMVASGEGGNLVFIRKIPPAGRKESEVFYVKEDAQGKELESVRLRFNRKGALWCKRSGTEIPYLWRERGRILYLRWQRKLPPF